MATELNEWLNKFVENGADPNDITNWPENVGGGGSKVEIIFTEVQVYNKAKEYYEGDPSAFFKVDKLIELFENKLKIDTHTTNFMGVYCNFYTGFGDLSKILWIYPGCSYEPRFEISGNNIGPSMQYTENDSLYDVLINNKELIESAIVFTPTMDLVPKYASVSSIYISSNDAIANLNLDEFFSLFKFTETN